MPKSGYDFYLKDCQLPIPPDKLQIKINNANETLTLINEGQINILKTAELTDIEFECRIPQVQYPFAVYKSGFKNAFYFLNFFEELKTDKLPFQFLVTRVLPNGKKVFSTNIKVALEDYRITEQAKDGSDVFVKIKLKQYRPYETKTVDIKVNHGKPNATVQKTRDGTPQRDEYYVGNTAGFSSHPLTKTDPNVYITSRWVYKIGDIVDFHGGMCYYSPEYGATGFYARPGRAKLTRVTDSGRNGSSVPHPCHLVHLGSNSDVYGWVSAKDFNWI